MMLCSTLCDCMDCSLLGSPIHGILQARILKLLAISFSRGSSQPRDWTQVSFIAGRFFAVWATRGSQFMMKTLQKASIEGTYLNIIKAIYDKPQQAWFSTLKNWNTFSTIRNKRRVPILFIIIQHSLEVLAMTIREEKRNKRNQFGK